MPARPDPSAVRERSPWWLLGAWRFERTIDDRRHAVRGRVTGEMIFTADHDRIRWDETGTLIWSDVSTPVTRTLYLAERIDGWVVTFADGRYFHHWRPDVPVQHPCGADRYAGLIEAAADTLMITWDVAGPGKDYTSSTRLTRVSPD